MIIHKMFASFVIFTIIQISTIRAVHGSNDGISSDGGSYVGASIDTDGSVIMDSYDPNLEVPDEFNDDDDHKGKITSLLDNMVHLEEPSNSKEGASSRTTSQFDYDDDYNYDDFNHEQNHNNQQGQHEKAYYRQKYYAQQQKEDPTCIDDDDRCSFWAEYGECEKNPGYMLSGCKKSCKVCGNKDNIIVREKQGLGAKYGDPQKSDAIHKDAILKQVQSMEKYMEDEVSKPLYDKVRNECMNRHELCALWVVQGECDANPSYMTLQCAAMCQTCHLLDFDTRCPKDPNVKDVFGPGDLNKMFERIVATENNVTVLSRPSFLEGEDDTNATYKIGPWVITVDDFIKEENCKRLIELGGMKGYDRSTDVGRQKFDGTHEAKKSSTRTSENAWCTDDCFEDEKSKEVLESIEKLTGIPDINSEYLQLLKYESGQFYRRHHDYIDQTQNRPPGPRILTAFLYLNDVEEGGGTNFPDLDVTVMPKSGKILLWPSVLDEDPNKKDFRTDHQALDVIKGIKYGANGWIHLRNFKTPHEEGCT